MKVAEIFKYGMHKPQMGTALSALMALKRDGTRLLVPYWASGLLKKTTVSQLIYPCHTIHFLTHGKLPFTLLQE
ncbi:MAG: hypothetical protein WC620_01475 [Methanoregula sp.]|jgi:hypothetical protein